MRTLTLPLRLEGIALLLFFVGGLLMILTFQRALGGTRVDGWVLPAVWTLLLGSMLARLVGLALELRGRAAAGLLPEGKTVQRTGQI